MSILERAGVAVGVEYVAAQLGVEPRWARAELDTLVREKRAVACALPMRAWPNDAEYRLVGALQGCSINHPVTEAAAQREAARTREDVIAAAAAKGGR